MNQINAKNNIGTALFVIFFINGCSTHLPYRVGLPEKDAIKASIKPMSIADYNRLGVAYEAVGKYENAISVYRKYLNKYSDNNVARTNLGNTLAKIGQYKAAEKEYREVLKNDPDDIGNLNNLAWLLLFTGDTREKMEGIRLGEKALELAKKKYPSATPVILDTLAWGHHSLKQENEAQKYYTMIMKFLGKDKLNSNPLLWGHYQSVTQKKD